MKLMIYSMFLLIFLIPLVIQNANADHVPLG